MTDSLSETLVSRTTTDMVFETLQEEIVTLKILPHTKISESEVANRLGVTRQPVRDAFNRLGNLELLKIRPQRPTIVRGFSMAKIQNARFVRQAIELETMRAAVAVWNDARAAVLEANLVLQRAAVAARKIEEFHALDYHFHRLICEHSGHALAFETVLRCKQQVDRLCVLSLARTEEASAVLADHEEIAVALGQGSASGITTLVRRHLARLDSVIKDIHESHSEYFE